MMMFGIGLRQRGSAFCLLKGFTEGENRSWWEVSKQNTTACDEDI